MNNYDDIINMPHHVSKIRKPMSLQNRSAQFAPFSALTGYDEKIREVARETSKKIELDDGIKLMLNEKLCLIRNDIKLRPRVTITYFARDSKKKGGHYKTITSNVKIVEISVFKDNIGAYNLYKRLGNDIEMYKMKKEL